MLVIPAIDLRGGQAVRLKQGDYARETVFDADPAAVAERFLAAGAKRLHLVDLDGARAGKPVNTDAIRSIAAACAQAGVPCQLGGGLRSAEALEAAFALGVTFGIVGTRAAKDPAWFAAAARQFPGKLILGLDARDGVVAIEGWEAGSGLLATDLLVRVAELPLAGIVYTDISKDGMMAGPNFAATAAFALAAKVPVIASGGVTTEADVLELQRLGVPAAIVGRSLYEGRIDLRHLLAALR